MVEYEIALSKRRGDSTVAAVVHNVCRGEGLELQMKTSLKKYPGSTHWHFKRPTVPGIVEVTWWPGEAEHRVPRLWLSIHGNRKADWMSELMPRMKALIEKRLSVLS